MAEWVVSFLSLTNVGILAKQQQLVSIFECHARAGLTTHQSRRYSEPCETARSTRREASTRIVTGGTTSDRRDLSPISIPEEDDSKPSRRMRDACARKEEQQAKKKTWFKKSKAPVKSEALSSAHYDTGIHQADAPPPYESVKSSASSSKSFHSAHA